MRVALVIPTLDRSGAEKQLTLLAIGLKERGMTPVVFVLDRGGPYEKSLSDAGVRVHVIKKRTKVDMAALKRLRLAVQSFGPNVVHTWLFAAHAYGYLATRRLGVPWVQSLRCVDSWKAGWQRWVDRRLWPRVARFVANSEAVRAWYVAQGVAADRVDCIPNGVPAVLLESGLATSNDDPTRASLGLPNDARVILCVSRLAPQKRLKDLLWAFQITKQANTDCWMVIVGAGPQKAELIEFARATECDDRLLFVGHSDTPEVYYRTADVFWIGSEFEGQSNSLQEAMSYGLPVVASDIDPNRELVRHGDTGYLVDVGDSAGFAQFTTRILNNAQICTSLGTAAKAFIEQSFSVPSMVERYAALYQKLDKKS